MTWGRSITEHRERRDAEKAASFAAQRPITRGVSFGPAAMSAPKPKEPSTRLDALRDLAAGEQCCGCEGNLCDPSTTVWAHPNGLAQNKGRGYKGHDHLGAFLGLYCHKRVDERKDAIAADRLFALAQDRTRVRLTQIAGNAALKPWRVNAARWALAQLETT